MSLNGCLVGVTSHITPLPAGEGLGEGPPPHGLETVRKKGLLNLWVLWEKNSPASLKDVLFLTDNTEEQNTQRSTETLSQPISQNLTAPLAVTLCELCMPEAFCGLETVRQKTPWTLCALWEKKLTSESICLFILFRGYFSFSQIYTEEQNTQGFTETLSQPISQNLTVTFSWNVLWILYVGGLLWTRNVRQKALLNLWVLWEKLLPSELLVCHLIGWVRSLSHRVTQKNRTHKVSQRH